MKDFLTRNLVFAKAAGNMKKPTPKGRLFLLLEGILRRVEHESKNGAAPFP